MSLLTLHFPVRGHLYSTLGLQRPSVLGSRYVGEIYATPIATSIHVDL